MTVTWLVWSELTVQQRSSVRLLPVAALLMGVHFFGGPVEAMVLPVLVIAVFAWRAGLRAALEDDRTEAWAALRALPIPPASVVTARYLSVLLLTLGCGAAVAVPLALLGRYTWPLSVYAGVSLGLALSAFINALHYRLGYRAAVAGSAYLPILLILAALVAGRLFLQDVAAGVWGWSRAHPAAAALPGALALAVYLASWAYATLVFSRREMT